MVPLRLAKTESVGQAHREGGAFSLLFVAPAGPFLPQAIYPVQHPALGTLEIFLVPVGPVPGGNGYHAVFTLKRGAAQMLRLRRLRPARRFQRIRS